MLAVASQTWAAWVIVTFAACFALMLAVGGLTNWVRRRKASNAEETTSSKTTEEVKSDEPKLNG